jgi:hypothetical protein
MDFVSTDYKLFFIKKLSFFGVKKQKIFISLLLDMIS